MSSNQQSFQFTPLYYLTTTMYELMLWRARVGLFNGVKCKRVRSKHLYCKSDITHCVIAIYKFYNLLLHHNIRSFRPYPYPHLYLTILLIPLLLGLPYTFSRSTLRPKLPQNIKNYYYLFTYLSSFTSLTFWRHPPKSWT